MDGLRVGQHRRGPGLRRVPFALIVLGAVVVGSVTMAYAASDKPSKPEVFYRDGKKFHRGKLAETTNDNVINGFPISELPRIPGGDGSMAGPVCRHTYEGDECSLPTPDEVKRDSAYFNDPEGARRAAAKSPETIQGKIAPEPGRLSDFPKPTP